MSDSLYVMSSFSVTIFSFAIGGNKANWPGISGNRRKGMQNTYTESGGNGLKAVHSLDLDLSNQGVDF